MNQIIEIPADFFKRTVNGSDKPIIIARALMHERVPDEARQGFGRDKRAHHPSLEDI